MAKKRKRLITRRRLKWTSTTLAALLSVVFALSGKYWVEREWHADDPMPSYERVTLHRGQFLLYDIATRDGTENEGSVRWRFGESRSYGIDWGWEWESWNWGGYYALEVVLPLWLPLLLIAAPTAWLWRTDRRAKPWQCQSCRYDLRGLEPEPKADSSESEPTTCPECGTTKNP